jgi:hypothetical protein
MSQSNRKRKDSGIRVIPLSRRKLLELFNKQAGKCAACGEYMSLDPDAHNAATIDVITPLSSQGEFNLWAMGKGCKEAKGNKPIAHVLDKLRRMKLCAPRQPQKTKGKQLRLVDAKLKIEI